MSSGETARGGLPRGLQTMQTLDLCRWQVGGACDLSSREPFSRRSLQRPTQSLSHQGRPRVPLELFRVHRELPLSSSEHERDQALESRER